MKYVLIVVAHYLEDADASRMVEVVVGPFDSVNAAETYAKTHGKKHDIGPSCCYTVKPLQASEMEDEY